MKNTFKAFLSIVAAASVFASCEKKAEPLASSLELNVTEHEFLAAGESITVTVKGDGDWMATSPSWITVDPAYGTVQAGDSLNVTVTAASNYNSYNELQGPKSGKVTFFGGDSSVAINVTQVGDAALDTRHTYKKVKAVTPGKSYLIVYKEASGNLKVATPVPSASSYGYLSTIDASESNGAVELNTGNYAFTIAESAAGAGTYTLQQADKRYIYVKGYNSYNVGASYVADGGYDNTITFDESGYATIKTTLEGKYMQYTSYKTFGSYTDVKGSLPMLYEDSKAASDEVLLVNNTDITVAASTLSTTFTITSNGKWVIYSHDSWVKLSATSGTGNATITATLTANDDYRNSRSAEIIVKGTESSVTVNLTQKAIVICKTIAEITAQLTSTSSSAPNTYEADFTDNKFAVVSYVNGYNVFIQDKTGGILFYNKNNTLVAGQTVSGKFSGSGYKYSSLPEITAMTGATFDEADEALIPDPVVVTIADLTKNFTKYLSMWVKIEGVEVTTAFKSSTTSSERTGAISQSGKTLVVYTSLKDDSIDVAAGSKGDIVGIPTIYGTTYQLGMWRGTDFEAK